MQLASDIVQFFTSLGWSETNIVGCDFEGCDHPEHPGLRVSKMPRRPLEPGRFVLSFSCPGSSYLKSDKDAIPRVVIDTSKAKWKTSVLRWFSNAVIRANDLRRKREEAVAMQRAAEDRKLDTLRTFLPRELHPYASGVMRQGTAWFDSAGTVTDVTTKTWVLIDPALFHKLPLDQRVQTLARLHKFLIDEKLIEA